jgi:hypothetical protein
VGIARDGGHSRKSLGQMSPSAPLTVQHEAHGDLGAVRPDITLRRVEAVAHEITRREELLVRRGHGVCEWGYDAGGSGGLAGWRVGG